MLAILCCVCGRTAWQTPSIFLDGRGLHETKLCKAHNFPATVEEGPDIAGEALLYIYIVNMHIIMYVHV